MPEMCLHIYSPVRCPAATLACLRLAPCAGVAAFNRAATAVTGLPADSAKDAYLRRLKQTQR